LSDGNLFRLLCCGGYRRGANFHTDGYNAGLNVAPKPNQQFASHCDDGDASSAAGHGPNPLAKPLSHLATRLVTKPEPGQLDQNAASRIMPRGVTLLLSARSSPHDPSA
jgi:hypothetical protein